MKFTGPTLVRLTDEQERLRQNHEARITELQGAVTELTTGNVVAAGRVLGLPMEISATVNGRLPEGTTNVDVEMVGGGGGGGGGSGGAGVGSGSGGGSGTYLKFSASVSPNDLNFSAVIGASGAAGTTAGTSGGSGGPTTLTLGGTTWTATGATGGGGQVNTAAAHAPPVGKPIAGSTAVKSMGGTEGEHGVFLGGVFWGGSGGDNPLGAGGPTVDGGNAGNNATGSGAGGGGGCATTVGMAGGVGGTGLIVITPRS